MRIGTAVVHRMAVEQLSPWPVWFSALYGLATVAFVLGIGVAAVRYGSRLRLDRPVPRHARHHDGSIPIPIPTPARPATSRVPAAAAAVEPPSERGEPDGPVPPSWLRPGQLRLLRDGRADGVAVTATLVDLAVRRFLRIQEVRRAGNDRPTDWVLVRCPPPAERLLPYEQTLLSALFPDRELVTMSTLRRSAGHDWRRVQQQLVDDAVGRGWFPQSEVDLRAARLLRGRLLILLGFGLGLGYALLTMAGFRLLPALVLAAPIVVAVIVLGLWVSHEAARRPWRRSPVGDAVLTDAEPYCAELAAVGTDGLRPERAAAVFSRSLPYAMALDLATEWSERFARLGQIVAAAPGPAWYSGSTGGVLGLHESVCAFATAADCTVSGSGGIGDSGSSDSGGWGGGWGGDCGGGGGGGGDSGGGSS